MPGLTAASGFVLLAVLLTGCASPSDSRCDLVCDCASESRGVERSDCLEQCHELVRVSTNPVRDCENALSAGNVTECTSACAIFGSSSVVPCRDENDLTDDDCSGSRPRKLECDDLGGHLVAKREASCVAEDPGDDGDYDVCCARDVRGETSASSSCTNTCSFAFDNDCDDGRPGALTSLCARGTDCADCE